jgi:hypothetical protein
MSARKGRGLQCLILFTLCLSQLSSAEAWPGRAPTGAAPASSDKHEKRKPNGISVGRPKVFDNRTLTIMLENLSESLRSMQFIDQKSLAAAFGLLQGFQSREEVSSLSVSTLPTPGVKQETIRKAGNATDTGTPLPDSTQRTTTTERASVTPTAPPLETMPTFSGFNPNYGENASDLLSDQVNLTYQIFNLRMLLERSLSDRLLSDSRPRRQAVLGFNVTIDPPRTANDAVAVVEVTLDLTNGAASTTDGLSLVSVMPQEKTYNAAALSTKSRAFGGAAVVKMIQVGYSERRRGQIFYLYRDTDTVAYERMSSENPNQVVFGWMFRPVLGRRSISPGLRQLFAIVALPSDDKKVEANGVTAGQGIARSLPQMLNARVRTYWKKYDQDTMTSFEPRDANRAKKFQYGVTLYLTRPEIFGDRYENEATYSNIEVKPTDDYQGGLRPEVTGVSWRPVGQNAILISAEGNNFFNGTQVSIGDKTYAGAAEGLILKSNQAFDLVTNLDALANGPGAIIGRYGPAVPLTLTDNSNAPAGGIQIKEAHLGPPLAGSRVLEIYLQSLSDPKQPLLLSSLPRDRNWGEATPIVTMNGKVVPLPYKFISLPNNQGVILQCNVPDTLVPKDGGLVRVSYPFLPEMWTATRLLPNPASLFQIVRFDKTLFIYKRDDLGFTIDPDNPNPTPPAINYCWQLYAGDQPLTLKTDTCTSGSPGTTAISPYAVAVTMTTSVPDKIVLIAPNKAVYPFDVPKAEAAAPTGPKPIALNQGDAIWVDIAVKDVTKVASVEANQQPLKYRIPAPDKEGNPAKAIQVQVTRDLTAKPGDIEVTLLDKEGKPITSVHLQISCKHCEDNGGKQ